MMIFSKTRSLNNIFKLIDYKSQDDFLFINSDREIIKHRNGKNELIEFNERVQFAYKWNRGFLIHQYYFNENYKFEQLLLNNIRLSIILNDKSLLVKEIDEEKEKVNWSIYNYDTKKLKKDTKESLLGNPFLYFENKIFTRRTDGLLCFDLDFNFLWQRTYASLTGVEQNNVSSTILENNGKLYISISSEGRSGLFVLDITTGEEVAFYDGTTDFLVKDKQYIYTYKGDFCILKIDAQTNKVEEIPLKEVLLSNGFNPNSDLRRSTIKDNKVYFTQFLGTPNSKLGIINLDTKEMLYKYDFAEENGLIGSIEVNNGRVFVHTQDNTLHIFEREE